MSGARRLIEFARERLGQMGILVANAGILPAPDISIQKLSERAWDQMMQVKLKSAYSLIHLAVPLMIAQRSGRTIAISSTSGQRGEAFRTRYSARKGAIISFVKGLATELACHNILVNASHPAG